MVNMRININDFEIFNFAANIYTPFINDNRNYLLNNRVYLDIVLTDFCNQNCSFCIGDLIHDKIINDLDTMKNKVIYAVNNMNVKEVLLLGGEPTVYKELIPFIEWLAKLGGLDKIVITTNGLRLRDSAFRKQLFESGLTHINISFMNLSPEKQQSISGIKESLTISDIQNIYLSACSNGVKLRINNNIFLNNNDTLSDVIHFYSELKDICHSIKFSPLLKVDKYSVIPEKTEWADKNILPDHIIENLFEHINLYYKYKYRVSVIENNLQFGFVKNTMIPLWTPIVLNWNFGNYTGMMKRAVEENKINTLKLLPTGELSLSWNRELTDCIIKTEQ